LAALRIGVKYCVKYYAAAPAKNALIAGAGGVAIAAGIITLPAKAKIVKECH